MASIKIYKRYSTSTGASFYHFQSIFISFFTLKIEIKVVEYNIRNGSNRWLISTSIKIITEQFSLAFTVLEKFVTLNMLIKVSMYNICNDAMPWQMHDFLSDGNNNFYSISHHLRDIRKLWKMPKLWPWKLMSRSRSRRTVLAPFDLKCSILYRWIFRIVATWQHTFKNEVTHAHREMGMTIDKICKADFPKNDEHADEINAMWSR